MDEETTARGLRGGLQSDDRRRPEQIEAPFHVYLDEPSGSGRSSTLRRGESCPSQSLGEIEEEDGLNANGASPDEEVD